MAVHEGLCSGNRLQRHITNFLQKSSHRFTTFMGSPRRIMLHIRLLCDLRNPFWESDFYKIKKQDKVLPAMMCRYNIGKLCTHINPS